MNRWWLASLTTFAFVSAQAAQVSVKVIDRDGRPVGGLVVLLQSPGPTGTKAQGSPAIMDQIEQRFLPFVLPVRTGTAVTFPNSDSVAHQVYSFSPPKRFELGLYRGRPHAPVVFDKPGIVVLGCNIHDKMIGYVYVTDAPLFGKTNERGTWRVDDVTPAEYRLEVWSPLLARDEPPLARSLAINESRATDIVIRLTRPMQPEPLPQTDRKVRDY
jgi:plastocyanin